MAFCLYLMGFGGMDAQANGGTGRISGRVLDPKGITVSGVSVKLVNAAGTVIREAHTDEKGSFQLEGIDPGEYQLNAESTGLRIP
jgi:uncharacterized surface anchored protein